MKREDLVDFVSMIINSMNMGYDFVSAVSMVENKVEPPLSNYISDFVEEVKTITREEGLCNFANKANIPEVHRIVKNLIYLDSMGGNIVTGLQPILEDLQALPLNTVLEETELEPIIPSKVTEQEEEAKELERIDGNIYLKDIEEYTKLKIEIHNYVLENFRPVDRFELDAKKLWEANHKQVENSISEYLENNRIDFAADALIQLKKEIVDEALALGPITDLLNDELVTSISIQGPLNIFYEKENQKYKLDTGFSSHRQLLNTIERIVSKAGRRIDEKNCFVQFFLDNGTEFTAMITPISKNRGDIYIRKPAPKKSLEELIQSGFISQEHADILNLAVINKKNILISTLDYGHSSLLINALNPFIGQQEKVFVINSSDLSLSGDGMAYLETKPPSLEGEGEVTVDQLITLAKKQNPDRLIMNKFHEGNYLKFLKAVSSNTKGSILAVEANSSENALKVLSLNCLDEAPQLKKKAIEKIIENTLDLIVHIENIDGVSKVVWISEV